MATKKIALDPGHGLNTAGKQTPDGIKEWTLNDKVRDRIVANLKDYDVEFVHTDNDEGKTDESLSARVNKYLKACVDVLVSLHHNAYTGKWNKATGIEVWVDRNATDEDLALAKLIHDKMVKYTGLKGRGVKREDFTVINQNKIPAVLVEGGFMDGTEDYKVITSSEGQAAYARAVSESLIEYLSLKKKTATTTTSTATTSAKKSVEEIAKEVIAGKWGNGADRKTALTKAGYDYAEVQAKVDQLMGKTTSANKTDTPYVVKVDIKNLNIRKGPGTNYAATGAFTGVGAFTIVETKAGTGSKAGWGKLKSGAGWISLDHVKKI